MKMKFASSLISTKKIQAVEQNSWKKSILESLKFALSYFAFVLESGIKIFFFYLKKYFVGCCHGALYHKHL
jgi:hypothetical protein